MGYKNIYNQFWRNEKGQRVFYRIPQDRYILIFLLIKKDNIINNLL